MELREFAKEIATGVSDKLSVKTEITVQTMNNGVQFVAIVIKEPELKIAPVIYLEKFYEDYEEGAKNVATIINEVIDVYDKSKLDTSFDFEELANFQEMREYLRIKIINREENINYLQDKPYEKFFDLAKVAYLDLSGLNMEGATVVVNNQLLNSWGLNEEELLVEAWENTKRYELPVRSSILDILFQECDIDKNMISELEMEDDMLVISNEHRRYGASAIFYDGMCEDIAHRLDDDFYIIPSSIHETIVIGKSKYDSVSELKAMIHEVNTTILSKEDMLSECVYFYDRKNLRIEKL